MFETELSARDLARSVGISYEHVRRLMIGQALPSGSVLARLCTALDLGKREMSRWVMKDRMLFRFGDAVWEAAGIDSRAAPIYILLPLLSRAERESFLVQVRAFAEWKRTRTEETVD